MCGSEFFSELAPKVGPVEKLGAAVILRELFPSENTCCPFLSPAAFHIGHSPYYLCLLVRKFFWTETDVDLAGVEEPLAFGAVSVKVWRHGGTSSAGFGWFIFIHGFGLWLWFFGNGLRF